MHNLIYFAVVFRHMFDVVQVFLQESSLTPRQQVLSALTEKLFIKRPTWHDLIWNWPCFRRRQKLAMRRILNILVVVWAEDEGLDCIGGLTNQRTMPCEQHRHHFIVTFFYQLLSFLINFHIRNDSPYIHNINSWKKRNYNNDNRQCP